MKYYFKKFLKLSTLNFSSVEDKNKMCLSMFKLWDLYNLSFTNQRAYFNTIETLKENDDWENIEIFSIESTKDEDNFSVSWFQRRTQVERLKSIAEYLITKWEDIEYFWEDESILKAYLSNLWNKSIFPNNIIVSLNNELQYSTENFIHDLYLDSSKLDNLEDFNKFKNKIYLLLALNQDSWKILLENLDWEEAEKNNYSQLCFLENDILYIPIFELDENISNEELKNFIVQSPLYNKTYEKIWIEKIKEYEKFYKIAWIIDWQHRTMSLRYLNEVLPKIKIKIEKYLKKINKIKLIDYFNEVNIKNNIYSKSIAVTSFLNSNLWEQADIFLDINNNAKPVDKSLTYDLLPLTAQWITVELATKSIFDKFNQTKESPLYKVLFNIRWYAKEWWENILSQANFINEVKYYLKETKSNDRIFSECFKNKKLTPVYWLMYSFFEKVNNLYWDTIFKNWLYNDKDFALYRTTWFWALLQLMVNILVETKANIHDYNEDTYNNPENNINKLFDKYLEILYEKIKFSRSELSSFRWKWWQLDLVKVMKIIIWIDSINKYSWEEREKIENQMRIFNS